MALPTKLARDLLVIVNDPESYEVLQDFVASRIKSLTQELETAATMDAVFKLQGQLQEMRRLQTLREEANADAKRKET